MKISIGHAVEGDEFFGRERELARMAEILEDKKASIFIPGPRRIGKTSIVKEFIRRHKDRYKFVYFDLERRHSIVELCKDLMKEIEKSFPDLIKIKRDFREKWNKLSKMIKEFSVAGAFKVKTGEIPIGVKEIMERMEAIFEELNNHDFILAIDEFSDFLLNLKKNDVEEVELFLKWLRSLRQEEKIKLIITGSINIISTVEELNVPDLINDVPDLDILPLTPEEIQIFLKALVTSKNITFSKEVLGFSTKKLGDGIPFYIQLFADSVSFYTSPNSTVDDLKQIEKLYQKITGKQHKEFINLHSRLKEYLSPEENNAARKILAHIAFTPMSFNDIYPYIEKIMPDKERVNKLLKRLIDECYLVIDNGFYRFVSPMISDWWKNSYEWEK